MNVKKGIKLMGALMLAMFLAAGCSGNNAGAKYSSLVTLDVNPSIQLQLDDDHKVVDVVAGNDEAKTVLADMDLKKADPDVAMNAILGSLVRNGYLDTEKNTVLLSVENDDENVRLALEEQLSDYIYTTLQDYSIDSAVFSQNVDIDDDLEALMSQYGISYGKASLIEDIIDEGELVGKTYTVDDLVNLKAQDLVLIYQSIDDTDDEKIVGTVSTSPYISQDDALNVALQNAGLSQGDISDLEIDFDMENGVLTYDIEFKAGGNDYEYEVSASEGIIEREVEPEGVVTPPATPTTTTPVTTPSTGGSTNSGGANYDDTDYGPSNDGVTNYDDTDYGPNNDGVTNYDDTDYGPNNDGVTDYGNTDYGPNSDGDTDYSTPTPAPDTDYGAGSDGDTNYDDGGDTNYDDDDDDDD